MFANSDSACSNLSQTTMFIRFGLTPVFPKALTLKMAIIGWTPLCVSLVLKPNQSMITMEPACGVVLMPSDLQTFLKKSRFFPMAIMLMGLPQNQILIRSAWVDNMVVEILGRKGKCLPDFP